LANGWKYHCAIGSIATAYRYAAIASGHRLQSSQAFQIERKNSDPVLDLTHAQEAFMSCRIIQRLVDFSTSLLLLFLLLAAGRQSTRFPRLPLWD
jgi:hypothetical protein